jgi:hypothetical protein
VIPALTIAVAGLVDANNRVNKAAGRIVETPAREAEAFQRMSEQASQEPAARSAAGVGTTTSLSRASAPAPGSPMYIPSLAEDIVVMREAVQAYKANARVIKATDELARELMESLAR